MIDDNYVWGGGTLFHLTNNSVGIVTRDVGWWFSKLSFIRAREGYCIILNSSYLDGKKLLSMKWHPCDYLVNMFHFLLHRIRSEKMIYIQVKVEYYEQQNCCMPSVTVTINYNEGLIKVEYRFSALLVFDALQHVFIAWITLSLVVQ